MIKTTAVLLTLCAAGACVAQMPATAAPHAVAPTKHFRLTLVLAYPQSKKPSQSFVLDVPVAPNRAGMGGINMAAGPTGQEEGSVQQSLQWTDVQRSAKGLEGRVTFVVDSVDAQAMPGSTEHLHSSFRFEKKIDVSLAKPTIVTDEAHLVPLGKKDDALSSVPPPAPQITVTATEL